MSKRQVDSAWIQLAGPANETGYPNAPVIKVPFLSAQPRIVAPGGRTIITHENNDSIFHLILVFKELQHTSHLLIDPFDHAKDDRFPAPDAAVVVTLPILVLYQARRMGRIKRDITKEGASPLRSVSSIQSIAASARISVM